jgi:hypothetical protein
MSPEKEKQFIAEWSKKRISGRWHFAFRYGVFLFAWPVYLGMEMIKHFYRSMELDYAFSWKLFLVGFITWTVLGMLAYAYLQWPTHEKRYQNLIKKESD